MYVNGDNVTYFSGFGVEYIKKKFIRQQKYKANIYGKQANDSIMRGYSCIGIIDFKVNVCKIIPIYFLLTNMKGMMK